MITVMGEALVDIIVDAEGEVSSVIGGAELNTARAIARLGIPVQFLGGVSSDALGQRIHRSLVSDNIHLAQSGFVSAPTTLAIADIGADGSATYRFLLEGTSVSAVETQAALTQVFTECTFLHTGGIGLAVEPFASAAVAVVHASPDSRIVMIDPNFRPAISGASPYFRDALDSMLTRADIIKVSSEDLEYLFPGETVIQAARDLHANLGAAVLLTSGGENVTIISATGEAHCAVPKVDVVDTVGAGDSFSGGFVAWWTMNGLTRHDIHSIDNLTKATTAGIAVAAANCTRAGANPPYLHDLPADWQ